MQMLSAHTAFGLIAAWLLFMLLLLLGASLIVAVVVAVIVGPLLTRVFLSGIADRVERWLTTPK